MALITILEEKSIAFADNGDGSGVYAALIEVQIVEGETYQVKWDGVEYTNTAILFDESLIAMGNLAFLGAGDDTGEPFCMIGGEGEMAIATLSNAESHTIGIYQGLADEEPDEPIEPEERILLKDRNGNDIEYQGIDILRVRTTNGNVKEFVSAKTVEKTIDPDFSAGDIEVTADDGTLISKVTIEKPEDLRPENIRDGKKIAGVVGELAAETEEATVELDFSNGDMEVLPTGEKTFSKVNIPVPDTLKPEHIAEGVNIAGIIGALAAGGSGVKIAYGQVTTSTNSSNRYMEINHNLGVVPDIVIFQAATGSTSNDIWFAFGVSKAFHSIYPLNHSNLYVLNTSSGYKCYQNVFIDVRTSGPCLYGATAEKFNIGEKPYYITATTSKPAIWIAIAGLT